MGQHDLSYRLFFSHRRMIQDLLGEIVGERWVERLDFDSGELTDASFVSDKHENRESDLIWKFRRKDGGEPVDVYVLLEFQSRPDPSRRKPPHSLWRSSKPCWLKASIVGTVRSEKKAVRRGRPGWCFGNSD
jgi:hypothetical protein